MKERPFIYAKAEPKKNRILAKTIIGLDRLEYHLDSNYYEDANSLISDEIIKMADVGNIHSPIDPIKITDMIGIEECCMKKDLKPIENLFKLAQRCSDIWKHNVCIVFHTYLSPSFWQQSDYLKDRVYTVLENLLNKYPNVEIAIENSIPINVNNKLNIFFNDGAFITPVNIAKDICKELKTTKVGTVLDTCHMNITCNQMKTILTNITIDKNKFQSSIIKFNYENFFELNKDYCKTIHLSWNYKDGFDKDHGIPFRNQNDFNQIMDLYTKYNYHCPVVMEVREDDYNICYNYKFMQIFFEEYYSK